MTIIQSEPLKNVQQEKGFMKFDENFDLNVTAQELEQQPDLQQELLESRFTQFSALSGTMDSLSVEAPQPGEQVPQAKTSEGCLDHLLILAKSAEIVAQSDDSVALMHTKNHNRDSRSDLIDHMSQQFASTIAGDDQECSQELLDRFLPVSHVSSHRCEFDHEVTNPRLTQIRKQARCKYLVLDSERAKDNYKHCKPSQGKTIRLNQIKHQARCKSKNDLIPQMIIGLKDEQPKGGILRLSQVKHQARSKRKSVVKEGTKEHRDESLHCNGLKAVMRDNENRKEHQCSARRLRAFKTKKLKQQSRTEFKRNYANTRLHAVTSLTGSTGMTNSKWLSNSATLLKDNDSIYSPLETSACREKLGANFGSEKFEGHLSSNELSTIKFKSLQHNPNQLPAQNNILPFLGLPNKQINSKYPPKEPNSKAQKEFIHVKRIRLTRLKSEARLQNQYTMQGPARN